VEFCKTRKQITGDDPVSTEFEEISGLSGAPTGTQQCVLIRDTYLKRVEEPPMKTIEGFNEKFTTDESKSEPFWILPIILISSIVLSLLITKVK